MLQIGASLNFIVFVEVYKEKIGGFLKRNKFQSANGQQVIAKKSW